ncbi:hypothetical protein [Mucilaginibacter polytrichastri]|uniref:hypothetical protein n=1 Tax=Mucilaginibacter polytrichastri TaxID=1302689 RepID=UPI0008EF5B2B|nr:hypothetical protein [Mucilaginibacter polytrichastri]SFT15396.1 hypothetical protein SAMN04487890_11312 [Mucilaginibacter polytrichastri]
MKLSGTQEKRSVKAAEVVEILKQNNTIVSEKEAENILDFLYKIANLSIETVRNKGNKGQKPERRTPRRLFR